MNILIVDDEPLAINRLSKLIKKIPGCYCIGFATNGVMAVQQAQQLNIDIVLMDIRMPKMDGLTAARHIRDMQNPPAIIFTTAFAEYALSSFTIPASGYLLKPVKQQQLEKAITDTQKLMQHVVKEPVGFQHTTEGYICCRRRGEFHMVALSKVYYMQSSRKYTEMFYRSDSSLTEKSLKSFLTQFPDSLMQINRGTIINRTYLRGLQQLKNNSYAVILDMVERKLPVSRRNLPIVRTYLKQFIAPVPLASKLPDND